MLDNKVGTQELHDLTLRQTHVSALRNSFYKIYFTRGVNDIIELRFVTNFFRLTLSSENRNSG